MTAAEQLTKLTEGLHAYVADLRERANAAGPQAYALTYRLVALEIESHFLVPRAMEEARLRQACLVAGDRRDWEGANDAERALREFLGEPEEAGEG